jgi:hypothetical protein
VLRAAPEDGWKTLHSRGRARGSALSWKKLVAELEFEQVLTDTKRHGADRLEGG